MATAISSRGRYAERPTEIPRSGWKDVLFRVKEEVKKDRLSMISAAMAYYALLAFVPAITSLLLIYAWVSDPSTVSGHLEQVRGLLPADMLNLLRDQLTTLSTKASGALGVGAIGALLFSLWSASKGAKAIMEGMNVIYDEQESRGFIKRNLQALGMTLLGTILSLLAIGVIVGIPAFFSQFQLGSLIELGITAASWLILLGLFAFFLSFAYRFGPSRRSAQWKWVSMGAVIAALGWAFASALFSWYASEFGNFNKTYGSLGAIIVLMMWFYITSFVVLLGGEINAEIEHQTSKDTTVGKPKPMGKRQAQMADTLGETYETHQ